MDIHFAPNALFLRRFPKKKKTFFMSQILSEQEIIRREKLQQLQAMGIDPFPAPTYNVSHTAKGIKADYTEEKKRRIFKGFGSRSCNDGARYG